MVEPIPNDEILRLVSLRGEFRLLEQGERKTATRYSQGMMGSEATTRANCWLQAARCVERRIVEALDGTWDTTGAGPKEDEG